MRRYLLYIAALLAVQTAAAQGGSKNAFSPYGMYGIGELTTSGTAPTRTLGGVGAAMRTPVMVNLINPAAASSALPQTFLFDFGLQGQNIYNAQRVAGRTARTAHTTFNFNDIAFQIPLGGGVGLGFSLSPYASVGYRLRREITDEQTWGTIGRVQQQWDGDGDVTEVKLSAGWRIVRGFSIGAAAKYYWGDVTRTYRLQMLDNVVGGAALASTLGEEEYAISRVKAQFGAQYSVILPKQRMLSFGAVYDLGGDLHPSVRRTVQTGATVVNVGQDDTARLPLRLPHQVTAGVWYDSAKLSLGADYVWAGWKGAAAATASSTGFEVAYRNTNTIRFGAQYTPSPNDVRSPLKRWQYRIGAWYGDYNQTFGGRTVQQGAITAGVGIPLRLFGAKRPSFVDLGIELGQRGGFAQLNSTTSLVRQRWFKFSLGITVFGEDYWFVRPKYD